MVSVLPLCALCLMAGENEKLFVVGFVYLRVKILFM